MPVPFLTAEWRDLVVVNYDVPAEILQPYVPDGTHLDDFDGRFYMSLVAFKFFKNKAFGLIPVPMATNFEEANLRFYVRREVAGEVRRGVAFIKEIVPTALVTTVARTVFNEPYITHPMFHRVATTAEGQRYTYGWKGAGGDVEISGTVEGEFTALKVGSFEEFILEHYWGYNQLSAGRTNEYKVQHPPWLAAPAHDLTVSPAIVGDYPEAFGSAIEGAPHSAFVAQGSAVEVFLPKRF